MKNNAKNGDGDLGQKKLVIWWFWPKKVGDLVIQGGVLSPPFKWLNTVQTHKCEGMELDKDKHKQLANLKKHKDTVHKSRKCIQNVVLKIGNALI